MEKLIIVGPSAQHLALRTAQRLNCPTIECETKQFPDGECYLRLDLKDEAIVEGKDVIIIQTTGADVVGDQNRRLMELVMIISAVKRLKAGKIRVVVPYFAYGRQDKIFRPGETLFAQALCEMIENAGADEFYSIDIHAPKIYKSFSIPAHNLDPMPLLAEYIQSKYNLESPVVISPDKGAYKRSRDFASHFGEQTEVIQFEKTRDVVTGEVEMAGTMEVENKDVIIADDIIATGGTMALAIAKAKEANAKQIIAVATHPLLLKNAVYRLLNAGTTAIVGTNAISGSFSTVDLSPLLAETFKD